MCMCGDDVERAEADETKARMPPRNTTTHARYTLQ